VIGTLIIGATNKIKRIHINVNFLIAKMIGIMNELILVL